MPLHTTASPETFGRKSAYVARNRVRLIGAAQKLLAEVGPTASIDQFAKAAQISVSTIYKHFETKEQLISSAFLEAFRDWEKWAENFLPESKDPIEELILPMRLFLRLGQTHPLYAAMIARNLGDVYKYFSVIEVGFANHVSELMKAGILTIENAEIRIRSISACLMAALGSNLLNPKSGSQDAEAAIEVILGILGVAPVKAKKIATATMPNLNQ
jgi:AcrR family transcriptional regulator